MISRSLLKKTSERTCLYIVEGRKHLISQWLNFHRDTLLKFDHFLLNTKLTDFCFHESRKVRDHSTSHEKRLRVFLTFPKSFHWIETRPLTDIIGHRRLCRKRGPWWNFGRKPADADRTQEHAHRGRAGSISLGEEHCSGTTTTVFRGGFISRYRWLSTPTAGAVVRSACWRGSVGVCVGRGWG